MTHYERLALERQRGGHLFDQGRWAEARRTYEKIIDELLKPPIKKKK